MKIHLVGWLAAVGMLLQAMQCNADVAEFEKQVDSLQKVLRLCTSDTTRVSLRFEIGRIAGIKREGYWDSLLADAGRCNMGLREYQVLRVIAANYMNTNGDVPTSIVYQKRALQAARKLGLTQNLPSILLNMSVACYSLGDLRSAFNYCYQGLRIAEQYHNVQGSILCNSQLGVMYCASGEYAKALRVHRQCLKAATEIRDSVAIGGALLDIGSAAVGLKDEKQAASCFLAAEACLPAVRNSIYECQILSAVGEGYRLMNQPEQARRYYALSIASAREVRFLNGEASALSMLATLDYLQGHTRQALDEARRALVIVQETGFLAQKPGLTKLLSDIYMARKDYARALEMYRQHISSSDSLSNEKDKRIALEKEMTHTFEKKENENRLLQQENRIQSLELRQSRYLIAALAGVVLLVVLAAFLIHTRSKLRVVQRSVQLEQKLLRVQMNPHFIFNSLQAIQNMVMRNEPEEATRYLSAFAFLTRAVLESSRQEYVPLQQEIRFSESYLRLQQLRFSNGFNCRLLNDVPADASYCSVPPMLTQPFMENAVEHGMPGARGDGLITVHYRLRNDQLEIEISDNGPGMGNSVASHSHQSMAIEITRVRIALLNKKQKGKVTFSISEAFPGATGRKGVRVLFQLPLLGLPA